MRCNSGGGWVAQTPLKMGKSTGEFIVTLAGLEQALLDPQNDELMDLIVTRLLLPKNLAGILPPDKGMGYDWW